MTPSFPQGLLSDDALPRYVQVAARLWADITARGAKAGDRLPSERSLAIRYEVSRDTLRAALAELANRGLLESAAARGWFVTKEDQVVTPAAGHTVEGFADYALKHGLATRSRVLESATRPATVNEAETLRIGPGTALFEMRRLRFLDGLVVVLEHNRVPLSLCPQLASTDFTTRVALRHPTQRRSAPVAPGRGLPGGARQPEAAERELLEIDDGTPVLVAEQLTFNQDRRPLELTMQVYRGDRYRFRASITD